MSSPTIATQPIRIGFVGLSSTGWASMALAPSLLDPEVRKHYKLVAISTTNAESAAATAAHYSKLFGHEIKAYHGDAAQIASDPDVDMVGIAVKPLFHKEVAEKVIAAGKPFFLEWQAGRGLEETVEIARLAKEKGVKSMVGLQGRQTNVVNKVRKILDSGKLGDLLSINANILIPREMRVFAPVSIQRYEYLLDRKHKISLITSALAHFLEIFTQVHGPFARVNASGTIRYKTITIVDDVTGEPTGKTRQSEYPDHITINGVLKDSGAWVNILLRLAQPTVPGRTQMEWQIDGEEGTLKLENNRVMGSLVSGQDPEHIFLNGEKLAWNAEEDGEAFPDVIAFLRSMWLEFVKGKEGGGNFLDIEDAVKHKALLTAIEESLFDGGKWVEIEA